MQMMKVIGEEGTSLKDYIDYLKGEFEDFAIETQGLEFGNCEVELNMGGAEFDQTANLISGSYLFTSPCNYLDTVEIKFSITDTNPLFRFDTPITYVFSVILDNRPYVKTLDLPTGITCIYKPGSESELIYDSREISYNRD